MSSKISFFYKTVELPQFVPDPFEFHQKVASQFDGSRTNDEDDNENEIVFSGSRSYQTDPFRVTDPPTFTDKLRESFEEAPIQSETFEPESRSHLMGRANQHTVEEPASNYAIYDPVLHYYTQAMPSRFSRQGIAVF